jgi:NAD(P)-dependent dehydrogenase (short-subunit alcohol dehydrogenase family)
VINLPRDDAPGSCVELMVRTHEGRVALVTGASSGIGRAVAMRLADEGAVVGVNSMDREATDAVVSAISQSGGEAFAVVADVTDATAIEEAVQALVDRTGRLDVLVTSAGIQRYGTVTETSEATWDEVFAINVKGVFLATRAAMPHLRHSATGAVVIISSVQALATQPNVVAYTASKGALNAFTRAVAVDEASYGVRVNAILPGSVDTPMLRASAALFSTDPSSTEDTIRAWGDAHPLGRVGTPEEVAAVASFLASPAASFVTGEEIRVDGGLVAKLFSARPPDPQTKG